MTVSKIYDLIKLYLMKWVTIYQYSKTHNWMSTMDRFWELFHQGNWVGWTWKLWHSVEYDKQLTFRLAPALFPRFELTRSPDYPISVHFWFCFFEFSMRYEGWIKWLPYPSDHPCYGIYTCPSYAHISWGNSHESGHSYTFMWERLFGGRKIDTTEWTVVAENQSVTIPAVRSYPEEVIYYTVEQRACIHRIGIFPACSWSQCNVKYKDPVKSPGKGENSWDQDDRATIEVCFGDATLDQIPERIIASVTRDRNRY